MRNLIRNGLVYDGSGSSPVLHDILIEGDRIQEVRKAGTASLEGDICVIDASGLAVTPGFIDSHRHCDAAAILDEGFGKAELAQVNAQRPAPELVQVAVHIFCCQPRRYLSQARFQKIIHFLSGRVRGGI